MYKDNFKNLIYPSLLNTIDDLKLLRIPPWEFINDNYEFWKSSFDKVGLSQFAPIARMINDDVIAALNIKSGSEEIFLFNLPLFDTSKPFKKLANINLWLKLVLEDSYDYITEY